MEEIYADMNPRDEEFEFKGKTYKFKVRDLTWSEKNKIIAMATDIDKNRKASFDVDKYNREALIRILVEAPFPIEMTSFLRLDKEFGEKLERFIPGIGEVKNEKNSEAL